MQIKNTLPGGKTAIFFFTSMPNLCKNLNNYFQKAWTAMKLPVCLTFTDLRTSIASHISVFSHKYIFLQHCGKCYLTNLPLFLGKAHTCPRGPHEGENLCAMIFKPQINLAPPTWRQNRPWSTGSSLKRHWRVRRSLQASHKPPTIKSTLRQRQLSLVSVFCRSPPLQRWRRAAPPPPRLRWCTRSQGCL